jgi:hypothetical protein
VEMHLVMRHQRGITKTSCCLKNYPRRSRKWNEL